MKITITYPGMKAGEVIVTGTDADGYTVQWSMADEDRGAGLSTHALDDDWILERYVKELRGDTSYLHLPCLGWPLRNGEEFHANGRCGRLEGLTRPQAMDVADMAASVLNDWMARKIVSRVHVDYTDQPCKAEGCDGKPVHPDHGMASTYCPRHPCRICGDEADCDECSRPGALTH